MSENKCPMDFPDFRSVELASYARVPRDERPVMSNAAIEKWIENEYRRLYGKFAVIPERKEV